MYKKGNKRKNQAEQTRRHIYETAAKLFTEKSFEEVTVNDIVAASGTSVGAFYHHFKNKQGIMVVTYRTLDEQYREYYRDIICGPECAGKCSIEKIELFMRNTVELIADIGRDFLSVFYQYILKDSSVSNSMLDSGREFFSILREMIAEGKKLGEIPEEVDTEQTIRDLTIIARGCEVEWCISRGKVEIDSQSMSLTKKYLRGLTA